MKRNLFFPLFAIVFLLGAANIWAALGNAWHIPDNNSDVDANTGGGSSLVHMRDPRFDFPLGPGTNVTLNFYQAVYKGGGDNETSSGKMWYRAISAGTPGPWQFVALGFFSDEYNVNPTFRQIWKATLNSSSFAVNDVIQYYFEVTFSNRDTTFLYGGDKDPGLGNQLKSAIRADAEANPYSVRNRPAFLFHANNRVIQGQTVQFWIKAGYIGKDDSLASRWADQARIYYTTDGSDPAGALGVGTGTTQVATMSFDHRENDSSPAGNAMWWVGTVNNLPSFTNIRYKLGLWHSSNNEEKFADYVAGTNNQTFSFSIGTTGDPVLTINGLNGNYTTTKLFVNELLGDSIPLNVVFIPKQPNVDTSTVQIYTNLNRRDRAEVDADGDGNEDGIQPPSGDLVGDNETHYYRAYPMAAAGTDGQGNAVFTATINAAKTGAYRLTARYRFNEDSTWHYYTELGSGRRDHAITVSPKKAREAVMYELNTINVESTGVGSGDRSTFDDLLSAADGDNDGFDPFNLAYLQNLGVNWLWFQPIHPQGIQGRQIDPDTGQPYEVGSPYAVKNFFEIMPLMGSDNTRADGLLEFQNFVSKADAAGMNVMLDAAFNHTAYDVEFAAQGDQLFDTIDGVDNYGPTSEIAENEARFFSRTNDYANRASAEANIAVAPDRGDFGKFGDTYDVFYGSYSALVDNNPGDNGGYNDEGDMFFYNDTDWTSFDGGGSSATNITRRVWKYFGEYIPYWLTQTGCPSGTLLFDQAFKGIDGLRADFGQGLPPQAWEYIINKARTRKWSFVFMAESLDGGAVTYRSNRHFDVLNENITFAFAGASTTTDYRSIYEGRRSAYGQGLVLLNTTSHDESNYVDPFEALIRFAVNGSVDGVPMIFYGQELGISGGNFGFSRYELNFGKNIPHFKKFNSLKPAWDDTNYGNDQLYPVYSGIAQARLFSPALRSSNRFFLNQTGGGAVQPKIFSVAKFETLNGSPSSSDVVFAFANLDRGNAGSPAVIQQGNFNINQDVDSNSVNDYGIKVGRTYDFKNIAAYLGVDSGRRAVFVNRKTGAQLLNDGLFVAMNKVPTDNAGWASNPYEAQYLKLYDVTVPTAPGTPAPMNPYGYTIVGSTTLSWTPPATDPEGLQWIYKITFTFNNQNFVVYTSATSYTFMVNAGLLSVYVQAINPNEDLNANPPTGPASATSFTQVLDGAEDEDGDGQTNADEDVAATNPFDPASRFQVSQITMPDANNVTVSWSSVSGKKYQLEAGLTPDESSFGELGGEITAGGSTSSVTIPHGLNKFFRVKVVP